jgi:hypothetical protein
MLTACVADTTAIFKLSVIQFAMSHLWPKINVKLSQSNMAQTKLKTINENAAARATNHAKSSRRQQVSCNENI